MSAPVPHAAFDAAAAAPLADTAVPAPGAVLDDAPLDGTVLPALTPSRRGDGWTAAAQRTFLEAIADGYKVDIAARLAGLTANAAYQLRRRANGAAFALGWRAAALVARDRFADDLMARVFEGQVETVTRDDGSEITRHRFDNRLAMSMLRRLDRQIESATDADVMAARLVAQEFDAFLGGLSDDDSGDAARAGLFLARRGLGGGDTRDLGPVLALASAERLACTGVATADAVPVADLDPAHRAGWSAEQWRRADAAGLVAVAAPPVRTVCEDSPETALPSEECEDSPLHREILALVQGDEVWFDEHDEKWRTTFAPPPLFWGVEEGRFGDPHYRRTLSPDEEEVVFARLAAIRDAASAEDLKFRDAWFGFRSDGEEDADETDADADAADDTLPEASASGAIAGEAGSGFAPRGNAADDEPDDDDLDGPRAD